MGDTIDDGPGGYRTMGPREVAIERWRDSKAHSPGGPLMCPFALDHASAITTGLGYETEGAPEQPYEFYILPSVKEYIYAHATGAENERLIRDRSAWRRAESIGLVVRRLVAEGRLIASHQSLIIADGTASELAT